MVLTARSHLPTFADGIVLHWCEHLVVLLILTVADNWGCFTPLVEAARWNLLVLLVLRTHHYFRAFLLVNFC